MSRRALLASTAPAPDRPTLPPRPTLQKPTTSPRRKKKAATVVSKPIIKSDEPDDGAPSDQEPSSVDDDDLIEWGAENIGRFINRSAEQVHYLVRCGALDENVVQKVGHKTYKATRRNLRHWAHGS
jgi:hypothetical protein